MSVDADRIESSSDKWLGVLRVLLTLVVLAVWEASVRMRLVNPFWVSSPTAILAQGWHLLRTGELLPHIQETLVETLLGLATGCLVGVPVGVLVAAVPPVRRVVEPYVVVLNAFPKIALAPLYLVWFGIALGLKVAMSFSLVVFVMILGTLAGFTNVRQEWINHARLLGASRLQLVRVVVMPALMPWIYTSFRLSASFALMGAVLGEFIATQRGIGYLIDEGVGMFDTTTVFVGLLLLLAIALAINGATEWLRTRLRMVDVQLRDQQVL